MRKNKLLKIKRLGTLSLKNDVFCGRALFFNSITKKSDVSIAIDFNKNLSGKKAYFEAIERFVLLLPPPNKTIFLGKDLSGDKHYLFEKEIFLTNRSGGKFYSNSSSGCAAHLLKKEAFLKSLLELIERDNCLYAWTNQSKQPHLIHTTLPKIFQKKIKETKKNGYKTYIVDVSRFPGIYTYIVIMKAFKKEKTSIHLGSASHPDPNHALRGSFLEAIGGVLLAQDVKISFITNKEVKTPSDHRVFYWNPIYAKYLNSFLQPSVKTPFPSFVGKENIDHFLSKINNILKQKGFLPVWFDLRPNFLRKTSFKIYRCVCRGLLPLTFGAHAKKYSKIINREKVPHPFG